MKTPIPRWFAYSILAGLSWAAWAILSKAAERAHLTTSQIQVLFTVGLVPPALLALRPRHLRSARASGVLWGLLAGLLGALGNLAFYAALGDGGKASIVLPVTSLYPLVTVAVAWRFMKERVGATQLIGAATAVVAIVMLSGEDSGLGSPSSLARAVGLGPWMLHAGLALLAWGLLSAAQKLSTNAVAPELSFAAFAVAFLPLGAILAAVRPAEAAPAALARLAPEGLWLAILAGAMNGVGMLASFVAYRSEGKASLVTPLAGMLSSVFTVILALVCLGERLDGLEIGGIAVALVSAVMLSWERKPDRRQEALAA